MQTVKRLYSRFIPRHYDIHWDLSNTKSNRKINGQILISGKQIQQKSIILHSKELEIKTVYVNGSDITDFKLNSKDDELIIPHVNPGDVELKIEFSLNLTDTMHGIYPCYFTEANERQEIYATQFESHHAREAFPCIDEPEAKATFKISLTHPQHLTPLSNMPVETTKLFDNLAKTEFDISPVMSSYLVAFVVGNIHKKSTTSKRGIKVSVWASAAQKSHSLDFALATSAKVIDFYEEYFGVDYPLAKCDHVALPDFSSGAMENWGLITYRESLLLADPKTTGVSSKHAIASVIAHELAHQWFGNLVTMEWWDYLWLNESFADFIEHIAIDAIYPEYETWLDFILSRGIGALRRDAIDGVQPVQLEVHHPDEISTIFDGAIVYGKGARLMKMLRAYIGDTAFRKGLNSYFKKFAYKNTKGQDLWDCLSEASGKDVASFMNPWILQSGYPTLAVDNNNLTQTQFFIGDHQPSNKVWPILLSPNINGQLPAIVADTTHSAAITKDQYFNAGDNGHFITKYSSDHLEYLLSRVNTYPTVDRLTLLHNQTLLVRGGYAKSADLINTLKFYINESNDAVWDIIAITLKELRKFTVKDDEAEQKLRQLSGNLAKNTFLRLGYDTKADEPTTDTKLRATVLGLMLYSESQPIIDEALARFDINTVNNIPAEIRPLIIGASVRHNKYPTIVDDLIQLYKSTPSAELKEDIVIGITSTRSPEVALNLLNYCKDSSVIRPQDVASWYIYLLHNKHTCETAWLWLRNNWDWVLKTFSGDKSYDEFPRYSAGGLTTNEHLAQYKEFFEPMLNVVALKRTISMGITDIKARVDIITKDGPEVRKVLKNL